MNEIEEIKLTKIIFSNCKPIVDTNTIYDGGYVVLDVFKLVSDIDYYYQSKNRNN